MLCLFGLRGLRSRCTVVGSAGSRQLRKLQKTSRKGSLRKLEWTRKIMKTKENSSRRSRSLPFGFARALEVAARACSASGRYRCSGLVGGPGGALDCVAQARSAEQMCEKAIRKRYARIATCSGNVVFFFYVPSMDMLGSTRENLCIF